MTARQPRRARFLALALVPAAAVLGALLLALAASPATAASSTAKPTSSATTHKASVHVHHATAPRRPHPKRKPWPVSVVLRTVPPLAGVRFSVDGAIFTTGSDGTVAVTREHDFTPHTLALLTPQFALSTRHYAFARWSGQRDPDQTYRTVVTGLPWRAGYVITAAFTEQCPVTPSFTDQHGRPIDPALLASATVKSDTGQVSALPVRGTAWLTCTVAVYGNGALTTRPVVYRLQTLLTSATNIVDSGRQAFNPATVPKPIFVGYFYDLTVTAHDALFGGSSGGTVTVVGASGVRYRLGFDDSHTAVFRHLPRGDYTVSVAGGGIGLSKTVRLSRDTGTDLQVVSAGDVGTGAGGGAAAALTLPLLARHRRDRLRRVLRRGKVEPT
ncbi:MAG TPA: hypothetical protein VL551_08555 [Actinospica sp.]|jgi:hypothetical protein|nr:hypothetical protein [Actinospica sp.]